MSTSRTCDGVKRRDFLRVGALGIGAMGLNLSGYLRMSAAGEVAKATAWSWYLPEIRDPWASLCPCCLIVQRGSRRQESETCCVKTQPAKRQRREM